MVRSGIVVIKNGRSGMLERSTKSMIVGTVRCKKVVIGPRRNSCEGHGRIM